MQIFETQFPKISFDNIFEKAYYSHTFGYRKPYVSSYTQLLTNAGLAANETLFIDDTFVNIEGAKAAGLLTAHVVPPTTFLSLGL
jgi:putative hydrolase of the HAD superfamily